MWVDMVLKPYVNTAPEDVVPILFLDSYHCHMTEFQPKRALSNSNPNG